MVAIRRPDHMIDIPRCLRWSFKTKPAQANIDWEAFFQSEWLEIRDMVPEDLEWHQPYWITATGPTPLAVSFTAPDNKLSHGEQPLRRRGPAKKYVPEDSPSPPRRRSTTAAPTRASVRRQRSRRGVEFERDEGLYDVDVHPQDEFGFGRQPHGTTSRPGNEDRTSVPPSSSSGLGEERVTQQWVRETVQETIRDNTDALRVDLSRQIRQSEGRVVGKFKSFIKGLKTMGKSSKSSTSRQSSAHSRQHFNEDQDDDAISARTRVPARHSVSGSMHRRADDPHMETVDRASIRHGAEDPPVEIAHRHSVSSGSIRRSGREPLVETVSRHSGSGSMRRGGENVLFETQVHSEPVVHPRLSPHTTPQGFVPQSFGCPPVGTTPQGFVPQSFGEVSVQNLFGYPPVGTTPHGFVPQVFGEGSNQPINLNQVRN